MSQVDETLIIIKPDGIERGVVGEVVRQLASHGLEIADYAYTKLRREWVKELYRGEEREIYYEDVVNWVSSAPILLIKVVGAGGAELVKWKIVGRFPEGIRGRFAQNWIQNVAHASVPADAPRELRLAEPIFQEARRNRERLCTGKVVLALSGLSECGKSTAGAYLESLGSMRLKIRSVFAQLSGKANASLDEFVAKSEVADPLALWDRFCHQLDECVTDSTCPVVTIESMYGGGLAAHLKRMLGTRFRLIWIDAPLPSRTARERSRGAWQTLEIARNELVLRDRSKLTSGIWTLRQKADYRIENSRSLSTFKLSLDEIWNNVTIV